MHDPSFRDRRLQGRTLSLLGRSLALGIIGWLCVASSFAKEEAPSLRRDWREMSTPHFTLFGDASERQLRTVAHSLESLRSFLDQLSSFQVEDPVPTFVYVFRSKRSFAPFEVRGFDGKPRGIAGFFIDHPHANYIAIDGSQRDALAGIAQHEYVHFFTRHRLPPVPLWFNEGLAEFYSTFEATNDKVNVGKVIPRHLRWLQENSLIPWLDFFSVTHWSPEYYNEGTRRGVFYAQSWALVHYLYLQAEGGRTQLTEFLELQGELPKAAAFEQAFGTSPEELERQLRRYVRSRSFTYRRADLPTANLSERIPIRTMTEPEALARLGELLAVQGIFRFKEGDAYLRTALEKDGDLVDGHVGLGLLQLHAGNWGDADKMFGHFQAARRLAPEDRRISFLMAQARARRGDPPAELRAELTRMVNANQRFLDAWRLLAWSWSGETENLEEAIRVFEGIHRRLPDETIYAEHLHRLYRDAERLQDAVRLIEAHFRPRGLEPAAEPSSPPRP